MRFAGTFSKNVITHLSWSTKHAASLLIVLLFCASALADNKGDHLNLSGTLFGDSTDFLQSADGRYRLVMQADCNLVLYKNRFAFWASGTNRKGTHCRAVMQGDGNFVVYTGNTPLWASKTEHHGGAFVIQQNDGNLVVYQGHVPLWSSNTRVPEPAARLVNGHPTILNPGESLQGVSNDFLQAGLRAASKPNSVLVAGCDEPGTPNQEQLRSDGHRQLIYSFENTARVTPHERSDETGKVTIYFDMNMGDGNNPNGQNWTYVEGNGPHILGNHERVTFRISTQQTQQVNPANRRAQRVDRPLEVGKKYCMTVWSRTSPGGCRSAQHSSWQCAVVLP